MVTERCVSERQKGIGHYLRVVGKAIDHALGGNIPEWTRGADGQDLGLRIKEDRIRDLLIRGLERVGVIVDDDEVVAALGQAKGISTIIRGSLLTEFQEFPHGADSILVDPGKPVILETVIPQDQFGLFKGKPYRTEYVFPADYRQPPSAAARFAEDREEIKAGPKVLLDGLTAYFDEGLFLMRLTRVEAKDFSENFYPKHGTYQYALPL